jgi:CubicO group peptidase (beta-lactamase class C family)
MKRLVALVVLATASLLGCAKQEQVEILAPYAGDRGEEIAQAIRRTYESKFFELDETAQAHYAVRIYRATGRTPDLDAVSVDAARWIENLERLLEGLGEEGFLQRESHEVYVARREITEVLRARKEMFRSREEMLFHRRVLFAARKLRDLGLHEGVFRDTYQAAQRHLRNVDWRNFLLDPGVIRPYAAQTSNLVFWLKRLEIIDLEDDYTRAFKHVFLTADDHQLSAAEYQNKLYGLTHFIIADSLYYQRMVQAKKYTWILDYFDHHIIEILSWSKPDIVAEIALCYKLSGMSDHRVVHMAEEYLSRAFNPELGFIPSEAAAADFSISEHRNIIAYLVLADWDRLHEGPHLNADAVLTLASMKIKPLEEPASLPWGGKSVPELSPFDWAMTAYMKKNRITAGLLGVMKDSEVILERSYGWSDPEQKVRLAPDALMRVASLTKPFTAAAVRRLIEKGTISPTDRVFDFDGDGNGLLRMKPYPDLGDQRLRSITVQHLLEHKGGWDSRSAGDLTFAELEVSRAMGASSPPSRIEIGRWILGHPLQNTPGDEIAYSNEGYLFLGMIIEQYSGRSYLNFLSTEILAPAGIEAVDVQLGRTHRSDRHPREPWYDSGRTCRSVMQPGSRVDCAYGGWDLEGHLSSGRLITSTRAMLRFIDLHSIIGSSRGLKHNGRRPGNWSVTGGFAGTSALARQRRDGIHYVVIFNRHATPPSDYALGIREALDRVIDEKIEEWPDPKVSDVGQRASRR